MNLYNTLKIPFIKMQGTGNDFVIIDCRDIVYPKMDYIYIANRKTGVGCDQIVVLSFSDSANCKVDIYNPDGSTAEMCGNAARCVLWLITSEQEVSASIEFDKKRIIHGKRLPDGKIKVNMGQPLYTWRDIPMRDPQDTLYLNLQVGCLKEPTATNIGNPHVTFFVEDVDKVPFETLAPAIEKHYSFPNRVNVSIASISKNDEINVRVWERGTGITEACGSAACATLMAAIRRGLIESNKAIINLPGGKLTIEYDGTNVFMTGEVAVVYMGNYFQNVK